MVLPRRQNLIPTVRAPLLSIADIAGGEWPARARTAAVALSGSDADDAESLKVQLLVDIRAIFQNVSEDRITTKDLLARLHDMEDRPWNDYRRGKAITARQIGVMLRSFKIVASSRRFADGNNAKGYLKTAFEEAFSRYLPDLSVTPSQVTDTAGYSDSRAVTPDIFVTAENVENTMVSAGCDGVTAKKGDTGTLHKNDDENWSIDL